MFIKTKAIVRMCGDYVAFHEISTSIEYVFGDYFSIDDNTYEYLLDKLNLDWADDEALEKQDKTVLDSLVMEYLKEYERDYCDIALYDAVVELDNNGKVLDVFITL